MIPENQMASTRTAPIPPRAGASDAAKRSRHRGLLVVVAAVVVMLLVRGYLVQSFYIPSGSMEPTFEPDDRILVNKVAVVSLLQRGDLVVFDGSQTFASRGEGGSGQASAGGRVLDAMASLLSIQTGRLDYVKRVVGLPGDHVVCCNVDGLLTVNDVAVKEPYLFPGDKPSDLTFDVQVPDGRVWLMGDHRSDSSDSRTHLGDPGGGMVRLNDIIGRAAMIYWPASRAGVLRAPDSLSGIPANVIGESHT